jgi:hypothetical protein
MIVPTTVHDMPEFKVSGHHVEMWSNGTADRAYLRIYPKAAATQLTPHTSSLSLSLRTHHTFYNNCDLAASRVRALLSCMDLLKL